MKNDNNDINVFTYGYLPLSYWKNWFSNIKQFFRNIRYAWQRATKGYCDQDVWNLDYFLTCLMRDSIKHLADTTHCYPGDDSKEGKSYEDWQEYLNNIAVLLDSSIERAFEEEKYFFNPYTKEYENYLMSRAFETEELPNGCFKLVDNSTEEEKELTRNYFEEEKKIYELRKKNREEAFYMINKRFDKMWD